jgi:predicted aspartyl protease
MPRREVRLQAPLTERAAGIRVTAKVKLVGGGILAISNLICAGGALGVNPPAPTPDSSGVLMEQQPAEMRVRFLPGALPVVQGTIGGRPGLNIMIDTGTSPPVVDAKLAASLGLETFRATLQVFDGTLSVPGVSIPEIRLGPIHKREVAAVVRDLSYFKRDYGLAIAAIVGLDVIGELSFRLDYRSRHLIFGSIVAHGIAIPADADWPFAVASVTMRKQELRLLVDTGAAGLVLFGRRVDTRGMGFERVQRGSAENLGGRTRAAIARDLNMVIQGKHVHAQTGFLVHDDGGMSGFDGLLAIGTLGFRALSYDRASRTLYLER